jgi:hypothetical protein
MAAARDAVEALALPRSAEGSFCGRAGVRRSYWEEPA